MMLELKSELEKDGIHEWGPRGRLLLSLFLQNAKTLPRPEGNPGKKRENQVEYISIYSAFDIETTALTDIKQSFMYIWQWAFYDPEAGEMIGIYGRTWEAWQECADLVNGSILPDHKMVCLVHNLSYEFQFLSEYYQFSADDVFCTDARSVLKANMRNIEYRCTFRHANTSLAVYLKMWGVKHQKQSGEEFGYEKIRFSWTELSYDEMKYCMHDVYGLLEAYTAEMSYWKDTLYTIPYTATGYVRRISKSAWAHVNYFERRSWIPPLEVLRLMEEAFRGGDVHGSRFHATPADCPRAVISHDVPSHDRSSSYPDELLNRPHPLGEWHDVRTPSGRVDISVYKTYVYQYEKCVIARAHFKGLRLKEWNWEMPYISKSKCGFLEGNYSTDNGRILSADFLSTTITEIDFEIIEKEYTWDDIYFSDVWYCRKRFLPEFFTEVVRQFYRDKTLLKGAPDGTLEAIEYILKKQLLNSLYGMCAQKPIKFSIMFDSASMNYLEEPDYLIQQQERARAAENKPPLSVKEKRTIREDLEKSLYAKYKKKAFMPFSVGVYCTAWARYDLHRAIWNIKEQGGRPIYVDTDSVKYVADHPISWEALNADYIKNSTEHGAFADDRKGRRHYMGVYEYEYTATEFAHMGSKKYVYTTDPKPDGKTWADRNGFHITIAGVNKDKGAKELFEAGGFDAFHGGMKFEKAGGVQGIYNDDAYGPIDIDGRSLYIGRNVCLLPDTYTLGESSDYRRVLDALLVAGHIDGETLGGGAYDAISQ